MIPETEFYIKGYYLLSIVLCLYPCTDARSILVKDLISLEPILDNKGILNLIHNSSEANTQPRYVYNLTSLQYYNIPQNFSFFPQNVKTKLTNRKYL